MLPFFTLDSDTKAEDAAETLAQKYLPLGCLDYGAEGFQMALKMTCLFWCNILKIPVFVLMIVVIPLNGCICIYS